MNDLIGRSILVSGRVQGVFYRASTVEKATQLGLAGWVRNLPNGDVFIEVYGEPTKVMELIAWCKHGPPMATVSGLKVEELDYKDMSGFKITY